MPPIDEHQSFYFGIDKRATPGNPLLELLSMLRGTQRTAMLYLDSKGTKGFLVPITADQRELIHKIYPDAFKCYVLTDQAAAALHYNKTVRKRNERHLSQIFHLRNLNNWIKAVLIGEANTIVTKGWSGWAFQKSQILSGHYSAYDRNYPLRRSDLASSAMPTEATEVLIAHAVRVRSNRAIDVLDFGCGKGGDIGKWFKCDRGVGRYVGVDIAKGSLEDFAERVVADPKVEKIDLLICADMGKDDLDTTALPTRTVTENKWEAATGAINRNSPCDTFDVTSCQFAMHYMFQTPERANHFFSNMSRHLNIGGSFIATTMDCRVVADAVQRKAWGSNGAMDGSRSQIDRMINILPLSKNDRTIAVTTEAGKTVMSLEFDPANWNRLLHYDIHPDDSDENAFGIRYDFTLDDGVTSSESGESAAVKAPEWLVPLGKPLEDLAAKHDLELVYCQNFQGFVQGHLRKGNTYSGKYRYDIALLQELVLTPK